MHHLIFFLSFFLLACTVSRDGLEEIAIVSDEETVSLRVEIADEPDEWRRGLMGRRGLCGDCGVLFVFPEERELSFWMKDTLIPLDVLYFDEEGAFVNVETMEPCAGDPCPTYPSERPAKYALEVSAGFYDGERQGRLRDSASAPRLRFPGD